jgi:hypothetical protein
VGICRTRRLVCFRCCCCIYTSTQISLHHAAVLLIFEYNQNSSHMQESVKGRSQIHAHIQFPALLDYPQPQRMTACTASIETEVIKYRRLQWQVAQQSHAGSTIVRQFLAKESPANGACRCLMYAGKSVTALLQLLGGGFLSNPVKSTDWNSKEPCTESLETLSGVRSGSCAVLFVNELRAWFPLWCSFSTSLASDHILTYYAVRGTASQSANNS